MDIATNAFVFRRAELRMTTSFFRPWPDGLAAMGGDVLLECQSRVFAFNARVIGHSIEPCVLLSPRRPNLLLELFDGRGKRRRGHFVFIS